MNTQIGINFTFLNFGNEKPFRTLIEEEFGMPVFIENDASVLAIAISKFGLAKGVKNALVLKMSWGVGLGLILNGQLYRGHAGLAGEFSHIPIVDNDIICSCGKQGCLETETSALVLAKPNQFLTIPIQQELNKYCIPLIQENTRIVVSKLEENGGLLGAVAMVFDNIFVEKGK